MTRRRLAVAAGALAVAATAATVTALSDAAPSSAGKATPTYYGDVKPIVDGRCAGCHYPGGIAPFSLRTYRDVRTHRAEVAAAVKARIMPPWHAQRGIRAYRHDPSLTTEQIDTIVRWARGGAPRGNPAAAGPRLSSVAPTLSRVDLRVRLPQAYTPRRSLAGGDDYRCFVQPWESDRTRYVTGFNALPQTRQQVHHIIVYIAPPELAATVDSWDAAERGPGYGCFGGAGPGHGAAVPVQLLGGWAPGSAGGDFPAGTGIEVRPGSRLILQFHYNLEHGAHPDRSGLEFAVADTVEHRAALLPVTNFVWPAVPQTFSLPTGGKPVAHAWTGDLGVALRFFAPGLSTASGLTVHGAILHMHRLGRSARLTISTAGGATETLLAVPRWDFDWQRTYELVEPVAFGAGDRVGVSCTHRNTTKRVVTWGESSSDEMCVGFVYVAER